MKERKLSRTSREKNWRKVIVIDEKRVPLENLMELE